MAAKNGRKMIYGKNQKNVFADKNEAALMKKKSPIKDVNICIISNRNCELYPSRHTTWFQRWNQVGFWLMTSHNLI